MFLLGVKLLKGQIMIKILMKKIKLFVFLSLVFQVSIGCGKKDSSGTGTLPSIGGSIGNTPVGKVDANGLWVNVSSSQYMVLVNKKNNYGADCFIDVSASEGQQIDCIVDILEGDLYAYDLQIQFNAPPKLCDFVEVSPAWHWNQSVGTGPTDVVVNVDTSAAPVVTSCTARNAAGVVVPCGSLLELTGASNPEGPGCAYDLSASERPNCCLGTYSKRVISNDGINITDSQTDENWGGDVASCIGGFGQAEDKNEEGYPLSQLYSVLKDDSADSEGGESAGNGVEVSVEESGLNSTIDLSANLSGPRARFSTMANFFETSGTPHNHDGYVSVDTSDLP